jgi:hypothetical protein
MSSKIKSTKNNTPSLNGFMRKNMISPKFQNSIYDSNYLNSHASHASHVSEVAKYKSEKPRDEIDNGDNSDNSDNSNEYTSTSDDDMIEKNMRDNKYNDNANNTYSRAVRETDLKIYKMKDLLDKKKKLMFDKEKEIKEIGIQNSFLQTVVTDYEKYNSAILEEKIKQKKALKILSDHIRDISRNINSDEFRLNRVKKDQTLLLEEIQNIRDEIEYMLRTSGSSKTYVSSDDEYDSEYGSEYGSE